MDMKKQQEVLHSPFDYETHMNTFINYLEVIICPSGLVVYGVPSHQEKLIEIGMQQYKCSRKEFEDMCPREYWCDYMNWLLDKTHCVAVWSDGYMGKPNRFQRIQLDKMKQLGLLHGGVR